MTTTGGDEWLTRGERGQVWLINIVFRLALLVGRRPMKLAVAVIALWYRVVDREACAASASWLRRVHGREPGYWEVYRHLRCFAQVTLDKVFFLTGNTASLKVERNGKDALAAQVASGRGAVLLGSHLGSYDAMRASGFAEGTPIQVIGYFENARRINALLDRLNPELAERVIHLGDDPIGTMARVRERVEQGELVALLGDRVGLSDRTVRVDFMGGEATFPAGPFLLASILRCPIYLVFGIYHEPDRYTLHCEPFADAIDLPRGQREEKLREWVGRYASRLEERARAAPDNWFNFFDLWSDS